MVVLDLRHDAVHADDDLDGLVLRDVVEPKARVRATAREMELHVAGRHALQLESTGIVNRGREVRSSDRDGHVAAERSKRRRRAAGDADDGAAD